MAKMYLIRHGQTEWNLLGRYQGWSDVSLSDIGRQQAEYLATNFPAEKLAAVYSSDLNRAAETARAVAEKLGCPLQLEKAFRELDFGKWEGLTYNEIAKDWPEEVNNLFVNPEKLQTPEGESFQDVEKRAIKRIKELCEKHKDESFAVVAHGAINRTILCSMMHIPLHYLWSIRQDNTAVSVVSIQDGYYSFDLLNSTAHLKDFSEKVLDISIKR